MTRKYLLLLSALCALVVTSSCRETSATVTRTRNERMAKIGTSPFMPPLVYQKGQEFEGPDALLAVRIVEKMNAEWLEGDAANRKIRLINVARKSSELIPALKNQEADLIVSGFPVTGTRKEEFELSEPYYTSELMIALNPVVNKSITATNMKGQRIGVRGGSAAEEIVKTNGAEPVPMGTLDDCVLALKSGEVSGVLDDKYMLAYALDTLPASSHLEIYPTAVTKLDCAVAARKGEEQLIKLVNEVIKSAKSEWATALAEHDAGHFDKVIVRYEDRRKKEANEKRPRNVRICVQRGPGSTFDIYRMANLTFSLGPYTTSRIQFTGRVGCASVTAPPGDYVLRQEKFQFMTGVLIAPDDPANVNITITIPANGVPSVRKN